MRTALCICLAAMLVPCAAGAQTTKPTTPPVERARSELTFNREVFSGSETRLGAPNWVNADCTSGELPAIRIATPPQNGTTRMQEMTVPVDRPANDPRASCIGKPVQALAIFYKPKDGFTGADTVALDVDFHMGTVRRLIYKITVR